MIETGTIKAKETFYNGYRFRSRLEARWAVFFDALNIKFEYEQEGFELSNGVNYLPDFCLPDLSYYAEVKGMNDHIAKDLQKVEQFVLDSHKSVIVLSNIPYDMNSCGLYWFPIIWYQSTYCRNIKMVHAFFMQNSKETYIEDDFAVGVKMFWHYRENDDPKMVFNKIQAKSGAVFDTEDCSIKEAFQDEIAPIQKVMAIARCARFEHGENPLSKSQPSLRELADRLKAEGEKFH